MMGQFSIKGEIKMALTPKQINLLNNAIQNYAFPAVYYDCVQGITVNAPGGMSGVEQYIGTLLRSKKVDDVRCGLENILHWGYAQIGFGQTRVNKFRANVTPNQIGSFIGLTAGMPNLIDISRLKIPQYSGVSFVSKILMFLDPANYCTLDLQLAKLSCPATQHRAIGHLRFDTQIRITAHNQAAYDSWRNECLTISHRYYNGRYRASDIERGFFNLIQNQQLADAIDIYSAF